MRKPKRHCWGWLDDGKGGQVTCGAEAVASVNGNYCCADHVPVQTLTIDGPEYVRLKARADATDAVVEACRKAVGKLDGTLDKVARLGPVQGRIADALGWLNEAIDLGGETQGRGSR